MASQPPKPLSRRRSYYASDVNFADLAQHDPDFHTLFKASKYRLDFQDPNTLQQLTRSILLRDFGLKLQLPNDRLCPPVPVRWNYVRWLQDLVDTTSDEYRDGYDPEREVLGLDIGVGASCIYALLACGTRPNWRMLGSDIDAHSLEWARKNVSANNLEDSIKLKLTKPSDPLIPLDAMGLEELDFVMVNPPFFTSEEDMMSTYAKTRPPHAVCTGSANEMIYTASSSHASGNEGVDDGGEGGDAGFVTRLLNESLRLKGRVQWYSAMLGKFSSAQILVAKLKEHSISNFAVTNLAAGQKTRRWAVAWSFRDLRPRNDVARHGELVHALLPLITQLTIEVPLQSRDGLGEKLNESLQGLDVKWRWNAGKAIGLMEANENVWSRAARRKRKFMEEGQGKADINSGLSGAAGDQAEDGGNESGDAVDEPVALAVMISCADEKVSVRWLRGDEHLIWTSFCGMLKRALGVRM